MFCCFRLAADRTAYAGDSLYYSFVCKETVEKICPPPPLFNYTPTSNPIDLFLDPPPRFFRYLAKKQGGRSDRRVESPGKDPLLFEF